MFLFGAVGFIQADRKVSRSIPLYAVVFLFSLKIEIERLSLVMPYMKERPARHYAHVRTVVVSRVDVDRTVRQRFQTWGRSGCD